MRSLLPSLSLALVSLCTACSLNPQPEPPADFTPDSGKPADIIDAGTQANDNDAQGFADAAYDGGPDCASPDTTSDASETKADSETSNDASSDVSADASCDTLDDSPCDTVIDSCSDVLSDPSVSLDSDAVDSSAH